MRVEPNDDPLWHMAIDMLLDMKLSELVRPFLFILCTTVAVAIVTTGGEINLPPAATMWMGAALMLWMLLTLLLKNSLVRLSRRWTKKADAARAETTRKSTRWDHVLAYMHRQPPVVRHAVLTSLAALIALAILTDGRFVTAQYWRLEASDLAAIHDLSPAILVLLFALFVVDSVQDQFARRASMWKALPVLDEHLSPEIEQQVRAWAQTEGISFSLAVEHLLALGLADMQLKQFHEEMKWELSFSEPNIAKMRAEVRRWI